jgi:hypothetical protein
VVQFVDGRQRGATRVLPSTSGTLRVRRDVRSQRAVHPVILVILVQVADVFCRLLIESLVVRR